MTKLIIGWSLLILSLIGWPLSALTFAKDEPQAVLGLSWFAITITALDVLFTAHANAKLDDGEGTMSPSTDDEEKPMAGKPEKHEFTPFPADEMPTSDGCFKDAYRILRTAEFEMDREKMKIYDELAASYMNMGALLHQIKSSAGAMDEED